MAETQPTKTVNPAVKGGDHDRVAMLSLKADGSPDQTAPEFIGDKDAAIAATTEQFRQQAVSAADIEARGVTAGGVGGDVSDREDPTVEDIKKAHDAAASGAESSAKKVVESLHQGVGA
jgi:hypothetical protein